MRRYWLTRNDGGWGVGRRGVLRKNRWRRRRAADSVNNEVVKTRRVPRVVRAARAKSRYAVAGLGVGYVAYLRVFD